MVSKRARRASDGQMMVDTDEAGTVRVATYSRPERIKGRSKWPVDDTPHKLAMIAAARIASVPGRSKWPVDGTPHKRRRRPGRPPSPDRRPVVAGRIYVKQLRIRNYRSFKDARFSFSQSCNIIVGRNNAGKSNLLRALEIVLGMGKTTLYTNDFRNQRHPVVIEATLSCLNEAVVESFAGKNCVVDDEIKLIYRCDPVVTREESKESETGEVEVETHDPSPTTGGKRQRAAKLKPSSELKNAVTTISIPCQRDASRTDATFQQLLKAVLNQAMRSSLQKANRVLRSTAKSDSFTSLSDELKVELNNISGMGINEVKLEPVELTAEGLLKQFRIKIDDGKSTYIEQKGYGLQNSLVMALLQMVARRGKQGLIFTIEEPEIGMDILTQRRLFRTLAALQGANQVFVSTHSQKVATIWQEREFNDSIIVVRRDKQLGSTATCISGHDFDEEGRVAVIRHLQRTGGEIFYADRVLLVEGPTEVGAMPAFARRMGHDFDLENVLVLPTHGASAMAAFIKLCRMLGLHYHALMDFDATSPSNKVHELLYKTYELLSETNYKQVINTLQRRGSGKKQISDEEAARRINAALEAVNCQILPTDIENVFVDHFKQADGTTDPRLSYVYTAWAKVYTQEKADRVRTSVYRDNASLAKQLHEYCANEFYWQTLIRLADWSDDDQDWIPAPFRYAIKRVINPTHSITNLFATTATLVENIVQLAADMVIIENLSASDTTDEEPTL